MIFSLAVSVPEKERKMEDVYFGRKTDKNVN
jgi:hypothetical protein